MSEAGVDIVTGGSSGIGRATARALAAQGRRVLVTARDEARARAVAKALSDETHGAVEGRALDLLEPESLETFAASLIDDGLAVHTLVHNAGAVFPDRRLSGFGFEAQLTVTYLGPFLLTARLWPLLCRPGATSAARVVNVASDLHHLARLTLDDVNFERRRYGFVRAFAQAELMKIMGTYALARRAEGRGVTLNCLHPGGVRTQLFRELKGPTAWLFTLSNLLKRGPDAGAQTSVWAATAPELSDVTGHYFVGRRARRSHARTYDEAAQDALWEWTCDALDVDRSAWPA